MGTAAVPLRRSGWRARRSAMRGKVAVADAAEQLLGADEAAQAGMARLFVGQSVRPLVALDADVGRDQFDMHVSVDERAVVEFAYCVHQRAGLDLGL